MGGPRKFERLDLLRVLSCHLEAPSRQGETGTQIDLGDRH
jgi:hypothetical protein